jgi:GH35 family endo-1,4-beta-xylanase
MIGSSLNRRDLIASLAGAGVIGGIAFVYNADDTDETDDTRSWTERTRQGIQTHRTTDLTVTVSTAANEPVADATVDVEMQAHDFQFGTAVNAARLMQEETPQYREHLKDLFNTGVLEAHHKWATWENNAELADSATAWLRDHGLAVRGHAAIWQHLGHDVVPDDVVARLDGDDPDHTEYLKDRTTTHVRDILGHYADRTTDWDVVNEQLHHSAITDVLDPDAPPEQSPAVADWFRTASQAAPEAELYVNDYDIVTGDEDQRAAYETLVEYLQDTRAPIDGVGFQAHFDSRSEAVDPSEFRALLDRFASLGVSVKLTEYDTTGDDWTERAKAKHLKTVLKTLYSHPAAEGFLMWGFWDGEHWRNSAPLFREDWSEKPAYDTYTGLVFGDWWTDESGTTDAEGRYGTQAYLGDYELTVTANGDTTTVNTSLDVPTSEHVDITLE